MSEPQPPSASSPPSSPSAGTVRVLVNGEPRQLAAGATVGTLIAELGFTAGAVAVERNREVVPRRDHGTTALLSGDELEVVTFVGGG